MYACSKGIKVTLTLGQKGISHQTLCKNSYSKAMRCFFKKLKADKVQLSWRIVTPQNSQSKQEKKDTCFQQDHELKQQKILLDVSYNVGNEKFKLKSGLKYCI